MKGMNSVDSHMPHSSGESMLRTRLRPGGILQEAGSLAVFTEPRTLIGEQGLDTSERVLLQSQRT